MLIFNTKLTYIFPAGPRCLLLAAGLLGFLFLFSGLHGFSQPPSGTDLNYYLSGSKNSPEVIRAGKIHKELIYKYSFDKHNKADTVLTDSIVYNSNGQVIQSTEFIHLYRMKSTRKFIYDSLGRVQKIQEDLASFKGFNWTLEYLYDSAGHEVYQGRHFDKDHLFLVSQRRVYDPDGRLIGIYQPYDFLQRQFFYSNSTGLLEKIVDYRQPKLKRVTYEYSYSISEHERKIVEIGRGTFRLYEESFFDEQGRITRTLSRQMKFEEVNGDRELLPDFFTNVVGTFSYNSDGTLLEWTEYRGKKSVSVYHHFYETY